MRNYSLLYILPPYAIGLVLYTLDSSLVDIILPLSFAMLLCFWLLRKRRNIWISFEIVCVFLFLGLGVWNAGRIDVRNNLYHYTNRIQDTRNLSFEVSERLRSNRHYHRYYVDILQINDTSCSGRLLLHITKDSLTPVLPISNRYFIPKSLQEIRTLNTPWQFDYRAYLAQRGIYHQLYAGKEELRSLPNPSRSLQGQADVLRNRIIDSLKRHRFEGEELQVVKALLLGQRQDIDPTTYQNYADAGAIHILAISGLHVGIIWLLLDFFLLPLQLLRRGRLLKLGLILLLLWSFAFIAGLSPSIARAVTMFSAIAVAKTLRREVTTTDALLVSMLLLLLVKPSFLYELGFQMSYLAVFAIVWLQPKIAAWWKPKIGIVKKLWQLFTVTLSAQLGVLPLSLYYFHQFPGLFFISNLVILPFLGVLLSFGILTLFLATIGMLPSLLASGYREAIQLLNDFIGWVAQQESFLFTNIPFPLSTLLMSYLVIVVFGIVLHKKQFRYVIAFGATVLLLQIHFFYLKYSDQENQHFYILHQSRATFLLERKASRLTTYSTLSDSALTGHYQIKSYATQHPFDRSEYKKRKLENVYQLHNGEHLLVVDSSAVYQLSYLKEPAVLLTQSPKINLNRLLDHLQPRLIIADGNNYRSYVARWKASCLKRNIPFHDTAEKGAYLVESYDQDLNLYWKFSR